MSDVLNIFLVLVLVVASWPSLIHVGRRVTVVMSPGSSSKVFHNVRMGFGTKRTPRPGDPPVCMAKLIMLRHRMQQANARRSQHRVAPMAKPNTFGTLRQRPSSPWIGQVTHKTTVVGRRWGINGR